MRRGLVVGGAGLALFAILMAGRDGAREATVTRRPVRGATARASVANDPAVVDLRLHRLRITPDLRRASSETCSDSNRNKLHRLCLTRMHPRAVLRRVRSQSRSGRRPFP